MSSAQLKTFQSQFFVNENLIQLNNAGLQPIPKVALEKVKYWSQRFWEEGVNTDADYQNDVAHTRRSLAKLIGCETKEVAFFNSTATAITQMAFSVNLKAGDEVVMWDQEYGSHIYPWKAACEEAGAKLVVVESEKNLSTPTEKYLKAITAKTKVLAFSWVQFQTGAQMDDLQQLIKTAKEKNILVCVDVIQGFGLHECNLWQWGVDAIMGGSHKWMFSPVGAGFLAVRANLIAQLKPLIIGAQTYGTCDDPSSLTCEPKRDATKFEPGSKQVLEITAFGASLDLVHQVGVKTIEAEALRLGKILREGLREQGFELSTPFAGEKIHSTPWVNFKPQKNSMTIKEFSQKLNHHKIFHAIRGPGIRFTTQAFNREDEIAKALKIISQIS